ncbi:hypothetical protein VBD025_15530 [Virgibacillus flavescens]|uniref:hypothetical protein n=1 Tax=Virgibacillus flavescens TaxID=1611422 RepID=UPI003D34B8B7
MKKLLNLNTLYIAVGIIVLGVVLIPLGVQKYNLWTQGINYFTNNNDEFLNNSVPIDGEYTVEVDLNNLQSNEGKELYQENDVQIYVSKVIAHSKEEYELIFTAKGDYSLGGATLVSGVAQNDTNDGAENNFQANAKATYKGDTFNLSHSKNSSELDEFGFRMELPDDIVSDLEEDGIIDVEVKDLYVNIWAEKSS